MKLSYGTQLSPTPINLTTGGSIRKPRLDDISELSFETFSYYEFFLKLTPELYFELLKNNNQSNYNNKTSQIKEEDGLYEIITKESFLQKVYTDIFGFFFVENVFFQDDCFLLFNGNKIDEENIIGIIYENNFYEVINIIQQICCINGMSNESEKPKFKNKKAKRLYEKMQKAQKQMSNNQEMSLPNIISSVSNKHPSINPLNVWNLTIFQLYDSFERIINNCWFEISSTNISVWGDEKNTFDPLLWCKNLYEK